MSEDKMAAIRAKLLEQQQKKGVGDKSERKSGDNASYQFWNIPFDSSATVRFLPDADEDNTFFWVSREVIKLPFEGVVGGDYPTDAPVVVTVPCVDMFDMRCPIISKTRSWWKTDKEDLARMYYKKRSYIFQGFVVNGPFAEAEVPENPIRRFIVNPQIFKVIESKILDPQLDLPVDYENGSDFFIRKTKQGDYANYSTSDFGRRSRVLDAVETAAIDQYGLNKLKDFLGRVPDSDELAAISAMFDDSLAGRPFDAESFGKYYRAYSPKDRSAEDEAVLASRSQASTPAARPAPSKPAVVAAPVVEAAPAVEKTVTEDAAPRSSNAEVLAVLNRVRGRLA